MKRLAGRPFVLLGVNTDRDRKAIKSVMVKERLNWRSWWDGGSTEGPIATQWQIVNWPTLFVIDHKGVIRYVADHGGGIEHEPIDAMIDMLVQVAESSAGTASQQD